MTDLDDFITQYVATWNEPNADVRRKRIEGTWSERASLYTGSRNTTATPASRRPSRALYDLFGSRGFLFRPREKPVSHHSAIRFTWEMITPADGTVDSIGTQFLIREDDGRIHLDYQFIGPPGARRR